MRGALQVDESIGELPGQLYLWPNAGSSFTRQAAAEFHTIGSPPLLEAALRTLCCCGARLAGPGEFTLRAFLAGRLDLTQAEAVLGVIDARDGNELNVALGQLAGGLGRPLHQVRDQLVELLAHLEAGLDFVEEEIEFITSRDLLAQLGAAARQVARIAAQLSRRAQLDETQRVVLTGQPNVGKSSLFNALAERSAAIVSPRAGTTRDYLTAVLSQDRLELIDTAGVDSILPQENPASAAQRMTDAQHEQAHLRILCLDATRPLGDWEQATLAACDERWIVAITKCDCTPQFAAPPGSVLTSSRTGQGLLELRQRIRDAVEALVPACAAAVPHTATRCSESLRLADQSLQRAVELVQRQSGEELVALEVRWALDELGQVVGAVYTDDLLDRIFSRFCIGK